MKRIRIPALDVSMSREEIEVLQTAHFQRLFALKQLGLAYMVYPYATHTRGAHSIRCLHEADRILSSRGLLKAGLPDQDRQAVRMAALLHDIGHVPFSHTLEDENVVLPKHDRGKRLTTSLEMLRKEVSSASARATIDLAEPVLTAISSGKNLDWRSDVVGNTICADLLAYIVDDAMWTGIEKRPGHYRVYEYFEIVKDRLSTRLTKGGLRTDIVSAIIDLLDMRYALTERVLFHHAKAVASGMLARAARLASVAEHNRLLKMGDDAFFVYLLERAKKRPPRAGGRSASRKFSPKSPAS